MAASVIYQLRALDVEPWFLQAVDKLRRGFLWAGKNEAHGGNCLVAWDAVCVPSIWVGWGCLISAGCTWHCRLVGCGCNEHILPSRGQDFGLLFDLMRLRYSMRQCDDPAYHCMV